MDEKKQIEEMAKDSGGCDYPHRPCEKCWCREEKECSAYAYAESFYNRGYRKIPEGAVVLTRDEYEEIPEDAVVLTREEYDELKGRAEQVFNEMSKRMKAEIKIERKMSKVKEEQARKETAREIFKALFASIKYSYSAGFELLEPEQVKEIAKQYGVEVE